MSETIRLNKVLKELNISIDRAVDFLSEKGVQVERTPNTKIDQETYSVLIKEFQSDAKQKAASEEVVINKMPDRKPEPVKEEPAPKPVEPEKITVPKVELEGPKTIGKIDLDQFNKKPKPAEAEVKKEVEAPKAEEPKAETPKIETPKVEVPKEEPKPEPIPEVKPEPKEEPKPVVEVAPTPKIVEPPKQEETKKEEPKKEEPKKEEVKPAAQTPEASQSTEPEKIKTQYQKLDGPNFTGKKLDLSEFEKDKKLAEERKEKQKKENENKKKRKRIRKDVKLDDKPSGNNTNNNNNQNSGNRPPYNPNRPNQNRPGQGGGGNNNNRPPVRRQPAELTDEQVSKQIKETLEKLTNKGVKSKASKHRRDKRKERREYEALEQEAMDMDKTLHVTEFVTVNELASLMDVAVTEVISACMSLGIMVTMNQRLEADTILLVADDFGFDVKFSNVEEEITTEDVVVDAPEDLVPRAPIVTVMGHVDHGKTSLLDYIRKANVIAGESGGITQHIGAYNVELPNGQRIAFLDTPGHEAFTAMRARGAQVTDMAIIVIAADDQVMPQTREAISHAQAAEVPLIFAINKIDKPGANPEKVKEQLAQMNLLVEDWGGTIQSQDISAKQGLHVEELLEKILLEAEVLELKANPKRLAIGTVVEAALDKGRGYVSTIIVQNGTLRVGDYVVAGSNHGKVRAMLDERGNQVKEAGPSTPVTILGLDGAPTAGDKFRVFEDEREAKQIATKREQLQREQTIRTQKHITLDEIGRRIALGDFQELNIILKGDVDGSVEALTDSLQKLSTEEIHINILHKGVGPITESDVLLASASDAIVIGFNVRPGTSAKEIADREEIEIRNYSIIYDAINDVKEAMEGMLSPELKEQITGNIEIRETFKVSKVGTIAGCMVLDGKVSRNSKIRLIRDGVVILDGELASLKRFKDDVKEVSKGYECGLNIKNYNDIQVGDIIEAYETVEVKKKLK
ncbi:translation initiation factor IF-2 [Moheibacter sediminis]|uniref:Translation initiation factor IF-2 n=1 Tax=Moheibacter sediminis TaxID=1434700 RepID=A0A1W2BDT1_9FLAO|nr:translation initiation factor IF-2 [Moheibacter sediminis]SMC70882.1 bacterial translation initiation factor 2 (bIF-2) [Moheibacter sediminis]